jgi:hypothetical protein
LWPNWVLPMHEESLVRSLLHQVEDLARQHHATEVDDIEVEIGPLSGVESLLVQEAFERLKDRLHVAELHINHNFRGTDDTLQSVFNRVRAFRFSICLHSLRFDLFKNSQWRRVSSAECANAS